MSRRAPSGHGVARLAPFTDAVVAIAMTLLVLPLVDLGGEAVGGGGFGDLDRLVELLSRSVAPLVGFVISFFVIARLWWAHHAIFEGVEEWTNGMVVGTIGWLFTIVALPWVTTLSTSFRPSWLLALLYVGDMAASSVLQTLLARAVLRRVPTPARREVFLGNLTTCVAFVAALVLCMAVPALWYGPLVLIAFTPLVDARVHRRLAAG